MKQLLLLISATFLITLSAKAQNPFLLSVSVGEDYYRIDISGYDTENTKNLIIPDGGTLAIDTNLSLNRDETGFYIIAQNLFGENKKDKLPFYQKTANQISFHGKYIVSLTDNHETIEIKKTGLYKESTLCQINKSTSFSSSLTAQVIR